MKIENCKLKIVLGIFFAFSFLLLNLSVAHASTQTSVTLKTNPNLLNGLVGHWTFDSKDMHTRIDDISGQGNNGFLKLGTTGNTATTTVDGRLGQALAFDGINDNITLGAGTIIGASNYSIVIWYKTSSTASQILAERYSSTAGVAVTLNRNAFFSQAAGTVHFLGSASGDAGFTVAIGSKLYNGKWHQIAFIRDSDTTGRVYFDGVSVGTGTLSSGSHVVSTTGRIASNSAGNAFFLSGALDDVRFYNRALSPDEISRLYNLGATSHIATTLKTNPNLLNGLVGHWTFDSKDMHTHIDDISGQGNNGSLILGTTGNTATTTVAGRLGQAYKFDGTNDYVRVLNTANLSIYSISFWIKGNTVPSSLYQQVISKSVSSSNGNINYVFSWGHGTASFRQACTHSVGGSFTGAAKLTSTLAANTWYFVSCTYDGTNLYAYLNGSLQATTALGSPDTGNSTLYVGSGFSSGDTPSQYFPGSVDDVRVYNRALSPAEISRLYNLGATSHIATTLKTNPNLLSGLVGHWTFDSKDMHTRIDDVSGQGNNGTLVLGSTGNTATTTVVGRLGQALAFDGTNDQVNNTTYTSTNNGPVSVFVWMKPSAFPQSTGLAGLVTNCASTCTIGWYLRIASNGRLQTNAGKSTFNYLTVNKWTQVGFTYDGTLWTTYKDGVASSSPTSVSYTGGSKLYVAVGSVDGSSGTYFSGALDDVRVYNRALSPAEVTRLYQLGQ